MKKFIEFLIGVHIFHKWEYFKSGKIGKFLDTRRCIVCDKKQFDSYSGWIDF